METKLQTIAAFAAIGLILLCGATGFAQMTVGDDTTLYDQTVAKISKTDALFAVRKTNFEKIVKTAKPNDTTICQSLAEWNLVFHDRAANFDSLLEMQKAGKFKEHRSKIIELIAVTEKNLGTDWTIFKQTAIQYGCQLSNRTSDGSENFFLPLRLEYDYFAKTPPSANDKAKTDKAFDALNDFMSQFDVKDAEDLIAEGYFDAALQKLDAIIKVNPNNVDALVQRANGVFEKKHPIVNAHNSTETEDLPLDSARADAEKAVTLDPQNARAHWVLGRIYRDIPSMRGERSEAEFKRASELADQAIAQNPKNAETYYVRGRTVTTFRFGTGIADFTKAVAIDSKLGSAYLWRGVMYISDEKHYEALADFNRAIEISPKSIFAYAERGEVYYHLGEIDKASADLRRAIEFDPKNANLAKLLKIYNEPVSDWEIVQRYKFFKSEFDKSNGIYEQQTKKYNETFAAKAQNGVVCTALTEVKIAFQNEKSASDKLLFVNNYSQIAEFRQAIADNKIIADFNRETSALLAQETVNRGCK